MFPPSDIEDVLRVLAALNLLNAVVKRPWGRRVVTYSYIKGMAAGMLLCQLNNPVDGVSVFWDAMERIVYFRVLGIQISFHYIPLSAELLARLADACLERQEWCGMQLQKIAVEVFRLAGPGPVSYTAAEEDYARYVMMHYDKLQPSADEKPATLICSSPVGTPPFVGPCRRFSISDLQDIFPSIPFTENKLESLRVALHFRIWEQNVFTLWRRKDRRRVLVARYDGSNYKALMSYLLCGNARVRSRSRKSLEKGKLYYVSPQKMVRCVSLCNYIRLLSQNSYLRTSQGYCNLCITYGIARYLGLMHPTLKFVCTLNYNHLSEPRVYYSYHELQRIPLLSEARMLKVWIVIDTAGLLHDFDCDTLPRALVDDYLQTEDYYQEFEVVTDSRGREGLVAYRRHELLETKYRQIVLVNYHAHVMGDNGYWAIYSLGQERFRTDFIYSRIWYDPMRGQILGRAHGRVDIIYSFPLLPPEAPMKH